MKADEELAKVKNRKEEKKQEKKETTLPLDRNRAGDLSVYNLLQLQPNVIANYTTRGLLVVIVGLCGPESESK